MQLWSDFVYGSCVDAFLKSQTSNCEPNMPDCPPTYMYMFAHRSEFEPLPFWMGKCVCDPTCQSQLSRSTRYLLPIRLKTVSPAPVVLWRIKLKLNVLYWGSVCKMAGCGGVRRHVCDGIGRVSLFRPAVRLTHRRSCCSWTSTPIEASSSRLELIHRPQRDERLAWLVHLWMNTLFKWVYFAGAEARTRTIR